jgi:REP element-mobilizing transposase RayT
MKNDNNNIAHSPFPKIREFDGHDWFLTKTYRRNLPHWELNGSTYFITIRVDANVGKPFSSPELASFMVSTLYRNDKSHYDLQAFVIMPDHLHIIIKPLFGKKLQEIKKILKGSSSYQINKMLNRTGKFWQTENFDHLIRDGLNLQQKWEYIKDNPVKAKLVSKPEDYPFSSFYVHKYAG